MESEYRGWWDITYMKNVRLPLHSFYDELPDSETYVIPIALAFEEEPETTAYSDLNWCEPYITILDETCGSDIVIATKKRILLWWIDTDEFQANIYALAEDSHITDFAKDMVMKVLERQLTEDSQK